MLLSKITYRKVVKGLDHYRKQHVKGLKDLVADEERVY